MHLLRILSWAIQRRFLAPPMETAPVLRVDPTSAHVCCLVHVYYDDLWDELAACIRNFDPMPIELRVNVAQKPGCEATAQRIRAEFPGAVVKVSPNRGRDIGGFFSLMDDVAFERHDIFCLLHTKKSPHMPEKYGRMWRRDLLEAVLGSHDTAARNVAWMLQDGGIGAVASRHWRRTGVRQNGGKYRDYLDRLGIGPDARRCEFAAGSIMFVRSSVLQRLHAGLGGLDFEDGDGKPTQFHVDGQAAHAIERVIGSVVRDLGLRIAWV